MPTFVKRTRIAASPGKVFAYHELPDALERLTPPWTHAKVVHKDPGLQPGVRAILEMRIGPITQRWVAEHTAYEPGHLFRDRQVSGPFAKWVHTHLMEPDAAGGCWLTDSVEYELPPGLLGQLGGGWYVRRQLERMFEFRHRVTKAWCEG